MGNEMLIKVGNPRKQWTFRTEVKIAQSTMAQIL
jgi:hypothetical protein